MSTSSCYSIPRLLSGRRRFAETILDISASQSIVNPVLSAYTKQDAGDAGRKNASTEVEFLTLYWCD